MSKKMTHQEFVDRVRLVNDSIEIISEYDGYDAKVKCYCPKHDYTWETHPASLLRGAKCHKCAGTYRRTTADFIEDVAKVNPSIEVLGEYTSRKDRILCRCKDCGREWKAISGELLNGVGCRECFYRKLSVKFTNNHDEFVERLHDSSPNIEILSTYHKAQEHVKCRCSICNCEWSATPNHLLSGRGCPDCAKTNRVRTQTKTHMNFIDEIRDMFPEIDVISNYVSSHIKVKCRCNKCLNEWEVTPANLLNSSGCPKCTRKNSAEKLTKSHAKFIMEAADVNKNVEILSEYKGRKEQVECKCKNCGNVWHKSAEAILRGTGCPFCSMSKGEQIISDYLSERNIEYVYEQKFDGLVGLGNGNLSYDFYLPEYNLLIEYQGQFHDGSTTGSCDPILLAKQQEHDRRKKEYAKEHDIELLEIWHYDYDNIKSILYKKLYA